MVSSRLTSRATTSLVAHVASISVFLMAGICVLLFAPNALQADDSTEKDATAKADDVDPDFDVPDGTPDEIMQFIEKLKKRPVRFANRREQIEYVVKLHRAFIAAGDKILKQDTDEKDAVEAATMKMASLTLLAQNDIGDFAKEALAAATRLKADKRAAVSKVADKFWTPIRMSNISTMTPPDRRELIDEVLADVTKSRFSRQSIAAASQLGEILANKGSTEEAAELYDQVAKLHRDADDPKVEANAKRFEGIARRFRLPGQFMALNGTILNGDDFDWASYRGKVVLVDFWATWCGPCVAELPNVKENYKKYHAKGFDVVGISLDQARKPLEEFIHKEEIPWTQLYDEEIQKGRGWNHPMAEHFGINSIPAAILVDQEGKVVSLRARGEELTALLEKLLGKPE